jgi:hypothetical protein
MDHRIELRGRPTGQDDPPGPERTAFGIGD